MRCNVTKSALLTLLLAIPMPFAIHAASQEEPKPQEETLLAEQKEPFKPFTGQVVKSRVRMRLNPSLESPILKELAQGDMVIVVGEDDEFYAVKAPEDIRGYVFRTYILDGVVEGHHVNVRLEPTLDSPIVAQLNSGEAVTGRISPTNNKWMEIAPPDTTRFYVSKDFVQKVGDSSYMTKIYKRRDEVNRLLDTAAKAAHRDLNRPFDEVDDGEVIKKYESIIANYSDFEQQTARAKELLADFKEQYTKRKIAYLEAKSRDFIEESLQKEHRLLAKVQNLQEQKLVAMEARSDKLPEKEVVIGAAWLPQEMKLYQEWKEQNSRGTLQDFYAEELNSSATLKGIVQPYNRNVKNKPGDYVLLNSSNTPIAFIYSTSVNLQDYIGQQATVVGAQRPNFHFAYPAYHVFSIE